VGFTERQEVRLIFTYIIVSVSVITIKLSEKEMVPICSLEESSRKAPSVPAV